MNKIRGDRGRVLTEDPQTGGNKEWTSYGRHEEDLERYYDLYQLSSTSIFVLDILSRTETPNCGPTRSYYEETAGQAC